MDIGVISVRYARALLKSATDAKIEQQVYAEMQQIAKSYIEVPQLRSTIDNPMLSKDKKQALLLTAAGRKECDAVHRQFVRHALPPAEECHPRTTHHRSRCLSGNGAENATDGGE